MLTAPGRPCRRYERRILMCSKCNNQHTKCCRPICPDVSCWCRPVLITPSRPESGSCGCQNNDNCGCGCQNNDSCRCGEKKENCRCRKCWRPPTMIAPCNTCRPRPPRPPRPPFRPCDRCDQPYWPIQPL